MQSSTRLGNWNISMVVGDIPTGVLTAKQIHGNSIIPVSSCVGKTTMADGLIGTKGDQPFGIRTADCMPLVLTTQEHIYALHVSRKTLVAGILEETLRHFGNEKIESTYIGPHICENCFTFSYKGDEIQNFEQLFPYATKIKGQVTHLSLLKVAMRFLKQNGLSEDQITRDERCTFETPKLPSYRRWITEGNTGTFPQMTTVIW